MGDRATTIKDINHFHELRLGRGGSSEAPALYGRGYEDMPSQWSLYAYHRGELGAPDIDDEPRVRIGKRMEALIADEVAHVKGWDLKTQMDGNDPRQLYVVHQDPALNMGCTVDRYVIEHEDGPGIIECKNRDYLQWVNNYTDEDPSARDLIQLCHQFACHPEIKWGCIAALVGGNDLKIYTIKRADVEDGIADVEARWRDHWRRVREDDEPDLTGDEVPDWLRVHEEKLLATDEEDVIKIEDEDPSPDDESPPKTFDAYVSDYREAKDKRSFYEKIEKGARAYILQRIGEHGVGASNRFRVGLKFSAVKASVVTVPNELIEAAWAEVMSKDQGRTIDAIKNWQKETRKAGVRVTMNIVDAVRPETHKDATPAALKAGMDAQAPLKKGSKK